MAKFSDQGELLRCSFCGKHQKQVKKLIAGPGVYICDECIAYCSEIITEEVAETRAAKGSETAVFSVDITKALKVRLAEEGPVCPECRAPLAESAVLRNLDIPTEGSERRRTLLFLICRRCGLAIDELLEPKGAV